MNTNINIGLPGSNDPAKRSGLEPTESNQITTKENKSVSSPASPSKSDSAHPVRPVEDRVEISNAAKAKTDDEAKRAREMAFARKALLGIPPLTEEKVTELRERIREQYYSDPNVTREISEEMTHELSEVTITESNSG